MDYIKEVNQLHDLGNDVKMSINNILLAQEYCSKMECITQFLKNKQKEADCQLKYFQEINNKVFNQAIEILDLAIDINNVQLAKASLEMIKTMKSTYPEFYSSFCKSLFL